MKLHSVGYMYQVVDVVIATAEATETLNAVTVGMVCLRNLQVLILSMCYSSYPLNEWD